MPLTPEDVRNKRFTPVRLREGYDMGEVDQFLDEVEAELERLTVENEELRAKVAAASTGEPTGLIPAVKAEPAPAPTPPGQAAHGRLSLDVEAWQAAWDGAPLALTVTEFGILRTLAAAPNRVFSRDAIIDHLRGPGFAVTDRTVDSHVRNLRGKFAGVGAHDVIETRAGIGYRLGPCLGGRP